MRRIRLFGWILVGVGVLLGVQVSSTLAQTPVIDSITPDSGWSDLTTNVTITGSNFEEGAKVSLFPGGLYIKGSVDTGGIAYDVYVSGSYAYVADGLTGLEVIDISDPSSPVIISLVSGYHIGYVLGVYVSGSYAYVAAL